MSGELHYLGVDLAWVARARTGLALLDPAGRLTRSTAAVTDEDIATFVTAIPRDVVAAIDAPLVVPNLTGRRDCEAEVGRIFGAYNAGAHPANRSRPYFNPPRGAYLAERFGWSIDPEVRPGQGTSTAIEVYPHPAMVALFGLGSVLPYKAKTGRDLESLRDAFTELLDHLERVAGATLDLASSARWDSIRSTVVNARRKSDLGAIEDEVDAIFCAYLAWLWGTGDPRMECLGSLSSGYIVIPGRPTAPPTHRPVRRARRVSSTDTEVLAQQFRQAVPALSESEAVTLADLAKEWFGEST